MLKIKGKVWKMGDNINTDLITPSQYLWSPPEEVKKHVLEAVNPKFSSEVRPGDIIVAGNNFGCGSSRETAPMAFKYLGIGGIVAESYARIFFRNAVAIGLPVIECPNITQCTADGDEIEVDFDSATIANTSKNTTIAASHLPMEMREVLLKGGIIQVLKEIASRSNS